MAEEEEDPTVAPEAVDLTLVGEEIDGADVIAGGEPDPEAALQMAAAETGVASAAPLSDDVGAEPLAVTPEPAPPSRDPSADVVDGEQEKPEDLPIRVRALLPGDSRSRSPTP